MAKWWDFGVFEPRTLVQGCTLYMYRSEWTLNVYISELFNSFYFPPVTICFRGGGTGCDGFVGQYLKRFWSVFDGNTFYVTM